MQTFNETHTVSDRLKEKNQLPTVCLLLGIIQNCNQILNLSHSA